ncbi:MAG: VCBS repeat-containing protein, partial [Caldilineaceae bacterium]|nr:VCBS repeat-containing protein [Caldilineaceae bacterium]
MRQSTTRKKLIIVICVIILMAPLHGLTSATLWAQSWVHLSTAQGELPPPSASKEQTSSLILDIDRDGVNDFVIGIRGQPGPSLVWYRRTSAGWTKYLIEDTVLSIEAGGAYYDIDGDGDLDIVMGGDYQSNQVWWWENPYPNYDPAVGWTRRLIKDSGQNKHHDQLFGDFDEDGAAELAFWNQNAHALMLAEIPDDPRATEPWSITPIYTWTDGAEHEGLTQADIDGDGTPDLVGGGRWFKHTTGANFTANVIDDNRRFARAAAGQLIDGGRPEVVFVCGDCDGPLMMYAWDGANWVGRNLLGADVRHGHTLA